ncbi:MAG: DUF4173 domain-containing protein [Cytophagaceae bacterium]
MKKNDIILLVSVAAYSYLFYLQDAGINFLIFTIILITGMILKNKFILLNKYWIAAAVGSLVSGICIALYGNGLAVFANVISLSAAASFTLMSNNSLIFSLFHAAVSYISSPLTIIQHAEKRKAEKASSMPLHMKFFISFIPLTISGIFLAIYRNSNPVFEVFTNQFSLEFISWNLIGFIIFGFLLLYGFYHQKEIDWLAIMDHDSSDNLNREALFSGIQTGNPDYEKISGVILFTMLNIIIFLLNATDIYALFFTETLPAGLTLSDYIHQGIYSLIISIVLAISIILYFFRGKINFTQDNGLIKALALAWIIQNGFLIFTCVIKNNLYVAEYCLTYKRIGVYVYLLLALIGLATTFIKIIQAKSNWFLFRKNSWAFYIVLILSCLVNWDLLIARYNISYSKNLDKNYIYYFLSDSSLPDAISLEKSDTNDNLILSEYYQNLKYRKEYFISRYESKDWQSWNVEDGRIYRELLMLNEEC